MKECEGVGGLLVGCVYLYLTAIVHDLEVFD